MPSDGSAPSKALTQAGDGAEDDPRFAPAWSPDSKQIAYISNKADYWHDDVWVIDVASGKPRQLSKSLMAASTPVWSPDGKSIALLGTANEGLLVRGSAGHLGHRCGQRHRAHGEDADHRDRLAAQPADATGRGDGSGSISPITSAAISICGRCRRPAASRRELTNERGTLRSFETTAKGDAFVYVRSGPVDGDRRSIYLPAIGGPPRQLTHFAETWEGVREPQEVSYRSFDGLYIQGFLYLPPNMQRGREVSGAGAGARRRHQLVPAHAEPARALPGVEGLRRDGDQLSRRFRLRARVPGSRRQRLGDAARRTTPPIAADFMRSLPYVSGKVGIYGYSYGGIMTMATIARYPDKYDAAVPMAGHLRLRRRADQRRSPRQDLHADRPRRRSRRIAKRSTRAATRWRASRT